MDYIEGLAAFSGAIGGLDKLATLYKSIRGDRNTIEISQAIDAIRKDLDSAREKLTALIGDNLAMTQKISALTEENMGLNQAAERHKAFDRVAGSYELASVGEHTTLYALKNSPTDGEPNHYLCVQCFGDRQKSIVQMKQWNYGADILSCPRCKAEYRVKNNRVMEI